MWRVRADIARTSFVGEREREKGFEGRGIVVGGFWGWCRWWMCRVESQEVEIRMLWVGEWARERAGAVWVERTVWAPVLRSMLCGG